MVTMRMLFALLVFSPACGRFDFDLVPLESVDAAAPDACTFGPWGTPRVQVATNSVSVEESPALSADGLTVVFMSDRGGMGGFDLWYATRPTTSDDFGPAMDVGAVNSGANDIDPTLSSDGLTLYFVSNLAGANQLYRATRATTADAFGPGGLVAELASVEVEGPTLSARGDELFFSQGTGPVNLMHVVFDGVQFGNVTQVTELDTTPDQGYPSLGSDGLDLYFETTRSDAGHTDIWVAHRPAIGAPFDAASRVDLSIMGFDDNDPEISRDGTTLIFASDRTGSAVLGTSVVGPAPDLWLATRTCQ